MKVFVVLSAVLALAVAAPGVNSVDEPSTPFRKMIANCLASDDTVTCLSIKGITALNRAARSANIEILPGVSFQRDSTISARSAKAISENEIVDSLPAEESERSGRLYDMAMDSLANFIGSHSLEVKFPKESSQAFARAIEEGRGKLKKVAGPLLLAFGAKLVALIPLFLGALIFLAIKALIVSKIAFVLAAALGMQRFGLGGGLGGVGGTLGLLSKVTNGGLGGGAGWNSGAQTSGGWSSGTGISANNAYPYARTYDNAQDLAYNAYSGEIPAQEQ